MIGAWLELPVWAMLLVLVAFYGATAALLVWFSHFRRARRRVASFRGIALGFFAVVVALGLVAIEERPFAPPAAISPAPFDAVIKFIPAK